MKARNTIFLIALLSVLSLATLHASISYEVQTVQTVISGPKLQVDFQIKSTGDAFVLGTSTFVVNFNTSGLGPYTSVARISANDGPWSGAHDDDYNNLSVAKGSGYAGITVTFVGGGTDDNGQIVPATFTTVGSVTIPITNAALTSQLAWRGIGSVTQVQRLTSPGVSGAGVTDITNAPSFDSPSDAPLPVELVNFTAMAQGRTINLSWATKTETNNYGFDIERKSINNEQSTINNWAKVGFIAGKGTTNAPQNYSYSDVVKSAGTFGYRLKQTNRDGSFAYSPEVEAKATLTADDYKLSQNYPNPFNPSTKFSFAVKTTEHVAVKVYNSLGQEVVTLFDNVLPADQIQEVTFDGSRLASGIYFYVLRAQDRAEVKKMLMVK